MKSYFFLFLIFISLFSCSKEEMEVSNIVSSSYVLINQDTLEVIEGNNYHNSRSVASISKIMTAIVVIENCNVNQYTIVPKEILKTEGSSIYLKVNEEILILDLLYGLLLRSGNDAAITLALATCDTIDDFVDLMNQKAKSLNMNNSYFSNPTGLDVSDSGNISSAYDMAILHAYCLNNPLFKQIVSSKQYKNYVNKNKLIQQYEYCTGGKTGVAPNLCEIG